MSSSDDDDFTAAWMIRRFSNNDDLPLFACHLTKDGTMWQMIVNTRYHVTPESDFIVETSLRRKQLEYGTSNLNGWQQVESIVLGSYSRQEFKSFTTKEPKDTPLVKQALTWAEPFILTPMERLVKAIR